METVAFYKTKLRLRIKASFDWFVEFELNEAARLSIADVTRTSMETCAGKGITITMEVEDINACQLFLEKAGLHPPAIRDHSWGASVFFVYDPEGNSLNGCVVDIYSLTRGKIVTEIKILFHQYSQKANGDASGKSLGA